LSDFRDSLVNDQHRAAGDDRKFTHLRTNSGTSRPRQSDDL
jgi:hypothetical protein